MGNNVMYAVMETVLEAPHVITLRLSCEVRPNYRAGQFITIFFPETGHQEGKAYSLSSSPNDEHISITVRGAGNFSNKLISKKVGDTIAGTLPYGYFYSEDESSPMVMIAGGIGIAPLRSMIRQHIQNRKIKLLYSSKTIESIVFKKELDELAKNLHGDLKVIYYITQEETKGEYRQGRIPATDIIETSRVFQNPEFFICGSIAFVRDYWKALKSQGVKDEKIYTEAFF